MRLLSVVRSSSRHAQAVINDAETNPLILQLRDELAQLQEQLVYEKQQTVSCGLCACGASIWWWVDFLLSLTR
jgi:hypothetical protein